MNGREQDFAVETACTLPPGHFADAVTADGHVMSLWERPGGRVRFGWDGHAEHPTFDGIERMRDGSGAIFCSADGAHVAYVGMRGAQRFVGRDGTEDAPLEAISRSVPPAFSRDGRHLAYGGGTAGAFHLVLDGQPVGELQVAPIAAVFSPDGERLAYAEMRGETRTEAELRIVVDGAPGEWFAGMRNAGGVMQFSPDSLRFAYCRMDGDLTVRWVIDGVTQRAFAEVPRVNMARLRGVGVLEPPLAACFSPDGRRFAYFADVPEKGVAIVEDDAAGPVLKAVGRPVFSPDSRRLAYAAQTFDGRYGVVVDGVLGPTWDAKDVALPVFSPDSRHVAVVRGRQEGGILRRRTLLALVVDGLVVAELPGDDASSSPRFSPDSGHVAWWVQHGEHPQVMLDDHPLPGGASALSGPVFTRAGNLVYSAALEQGKVGTVLVDGRPGPFAEGLATPRTLLHEFGRDLAPDPRVPFAVSPDGEHVAWIGRFGDDWRPVLDDRVGPAFFAPLAASFGPDGRPTWYLQREREVYRVIA
jgi:hypothetical protein